MRVRVFGRCVVGGLVVATVLSACSSPSATTSGAPSAMSVKSVSVAPDVPKDSIRDLNSTKDMTGVVTDIRSSQSPYYRHMPEMCPFFPKEARDKAKAMGADSFERSLASDILQSCNIAPFDTPNVFFNVTPAMYIEPISQILRSSGTTVTGKTIELPGGVTGYFEFPSGLDQNKKCAVAWGTFYGTAELNYNRDRKDARPACDTVRDWLFLVPYFPTMPAQMRRFDE